MNMEYFFVVKILKPYYIMLVYEVLLLVLETQAAQRHFCIQMSLKQLKYSQNT